MITTVTFNPCVDRTVLLSDLKIGRYNQIQKTICNVSGKGINVSLVLHQLGLETECVGLCYRNGGEKLIALLNSRGIANDWIDVDGELRVNLKITDQVSGLMTECNEKGGAVSADTAGRMLALIEKHLPNTDILVVDGSVPPGIPGTIYADCIRLAQSMGVPTVLDASGQLLKNGIDAKPWLMKPNRYKLETLLQIKIDTVESAVRAAKRLIADESQAVCLSLGADGAVLVTDGHAWYSRGVSIPVQGTQGAGDSMVAGMCIAALQKLPPPEMLRYGMAAAHGSLLLPGTELCTEEGFREMLPLMTVEQVE